MRSSLFLIVFWGAIFTQSGCKQQTEETTIQPELPKNVRAFYIGHSLSDPIIDRVNALAHHHEELSFSFRYQTIPGSPLQYNWEAKDRGYDVNNPFYAGYYDTDYGLPVGDFNVLVLTESVPRHSGEGIQHTYQYADSFYTFAARHNPDIQVYIYEVWHCINSGTPTGCPWDVDANPWRQRLDDDLPMWESVVETLNSRFNPSKPVRLIPGGQGMAALYDAIQNGELPGLTSIEDVFSDDIHINGIAAYLVSCIHFSTIYGIAPEGLPHELTDMWGRPYEDDPTPEQALKLQEIAWKVASEYARRHSN